MRHTHSTLSAHSLLHSCPTPHPQSHKNLIGSARITKVVWAVRGSSCSICSILATPLASY